MCLQYSADRQSVQAGQLAAVWAVCFVTETVCFAIVRTAVGAVCFAIVRTAAVTVCFAIVRTAAVAVCSAIVRIAVAVVMACSVSDRLEIGYTVTEKRALLQDCRHLDF